ncbi:aspartate/glutamate racemase family protein [Bordetella sp. BOR01]|uniref:aspartate/glutamate racemase family protein n=1 Tax=Bordetella sp. BOR01 TaxID=2854779 RepID=UPI001C449B21|nr:aspartate/glutamate racemase family protein [Bordetella sp. BOR01]MBV7483283.1 arylsulfatase [Bordetella sp. BOR01]
MRISFLHTIESNKAVFGLAAMKAGWSTDQIRHATREDLRQAIAQQSATSCGAHGLVHEALRSLMAEADVVIVTCATLGPAVDTMGEPSVPIIRADAALAKAASRAGRKLAVLCAVESSVAPNRELFEHHAAATGASVTVQLIPRAWALYEEGKQAACMAACAQAANEAYAQGFDVVAYAHPWMAESAELVGNKYRPIHGVQAALDAVRAVREGG